MKPHFGGDAPRKRQAAPRRKVARKTAATRPGSRAPRHHRPSHGPVDSGFSPMTVFLLILALGLGGLIAMLLMPKGLNQIQGYPAELVTEAPRNLLTEMQQVLVGDEESKADLTLTEAEINRYLGERIGGEQGGVLGALVKFQGVYADIEPGTAEIYVIRSVFGLPFAVSFKLARQESGYREEWRAAGGSIGRIRMSGKRQFKPISDAFFRIAQVSKDEIDAIKSLRKIELGKDQVTFGR